MKALEIVELIKQSNPKLLGKTPDARAAKIITAALSQIGQQLNATTEGPLKIPSLGVFAIKQVEREKDGQTVTVKKVSFRSPKPKAKAVKAD